MRKLEISDSQASKIHAVPLYSQLSTIFRDMIRQDKWPVGIALPSETDLARTYGVSVGTARKALESLQSDGWITRRQGRGTFVSDPVEQQSDRFSRIFLSDSGINLFGSCVPVVLKIQEDFATPSEAQELGVPNKIAVVRISRRMDRNDTPTLLEKQVLRADIFPGIQEKEDFPVSIDSIFLRQYGVDIARCSENITAINADQTVSEVLDIEAGTALLHTKRKIEDVGGRVVGLIERWFETQNATYLVSLT